jgi:hypothetical protein
MARRIKARLGAALALALLLAPAAAGAQGFGNWNRPRVLMPPSPPQSAPVIRRGPSAQLPNYYFDRGGAVTAPKAPVGPGDVANSLRARGFNNIGPVERRGNTAITEAVGPAGERVQLVIGPTGEIVGVRVLNQGGR